MNNNLNLKTSEVFEPIIYRLNIADEKEKFNKLFNLLIPLRIFDNIEFQLKELIKCQNPGIHIAHDEYNEFIKIHLGTTDIYDYGVWVYYPWNNNLVHTLDEDEFIKVRTTRNCHKITPEEQETLKSKKIGIIGLSVGQSIALTMAMERTCGEIRLADFDTAELSNLNRLRTGIHNLGINKSIIAAREIAEIDPFIKVRIFDEGLTEANINSFFTTGGNLNLLVEVCDGLEIKIQSRILARQLKIPVVMDTNDRGMLDIERFDIEPGRPILHGLIGEVDSDTVKGYDNNQKMQLIMNIVGADTISERLRTSISELGKSISSLPQLASSVVLGGAITTDAARRILLQQHHDSGRFYIDTDFLLSAQFNTQKNCSVLESKNVSFSKQKTYL